MGILTLIILQMNNTTSDNTQEQPSMIADIKKRLSDAKTNLSSIKKVICDPATKSLIVGDIKNILNDFNTKLIFIFVSLFVLCNTFITNVIDKYIDRGILSGFYDNIAERILFIVVIALLIYYSRIAIRRNKKVSNAEIEWAFTALLFWAYYRYISTGWTYVQFWNLEHIYYIDIVLIYSLIIIITRSIVMIKLIYKEVLSKIDITKGFGLDLPITKEDEHSFKRDDLAQKLATRIKNTNIQGNAFSIGIESPWGFGKTSFINLLCNHFEKKDTIIIKFNPWDYEKERNLVDAFFLELRENLKEYDSSLSTNLAEYAHILSDSSHDIIKFSAKFIECFSSQSIEAKRKVINSAIKGIGKLILVIIDDLDRLDKDEIMSVLKLIRNCASFSNMVFVSAYDREYLIETLKDDVCNSNKYLEKIFQYQFKLPEYDKLKLRDILIKEGEKFIDDDDKKEFKDIIYMDYLAFSENSKFSENIHNVRDVLRYLNSLRFIYKSLKGDIFLQDLMMIELLRMKYYDVYELLSKEHDKYLYETDDKLVFYTGVDKLDYDDNLCNNIFVTIGNKYIAGSNDFNKIENLLNSMFNDHAKKAKAINDPSYIDRYFYYSILDFDISEKELKTVMEKPYDEIKQKITIWLDNRKESSLSGLLRTIKINNAKEYQKIIRIIFYVGYKTMNVFLNVDFIYSVIIKSPLTRKENKAFVNEVLFENGASEFVAKFIKDLFLDLLVTSKFIFTAEELRHMSAEMFKLLCKRGMSLQTIYKLWEYTLYVEHAKNDNYSNVLEEKHNEEADSYFFEYFKSNYKILLPQLICKNTDNCVYISISYYNIWKVKKAFKSFFDDLLAVNKEDKQLEEFVEFMNKFFAQEKIAPISFDFKYINLN